MKQLVVIKWRKVPLLNGLQGTRFPQLTVPDSGRSVFGIPLWPCVIKAVLTRAASVSAAEHRSASSKGRTSAEQHSLRLHREVPTHVNTHSLPHTFTITPHCSWGCVSTPRSDWMRRPHGGILLAEASLFIKQRELKRECVQTCALVSRETGI